MKIVSIMLLTCCTCIASGQDFDFVISEILFFKTERGTSTLELGKSSTANLIDMGAEYNGKITIQIGMLKRFASYKTDRVGEFYITEENVLKGAALSAKFGANNALLPANWPYAGIVLADTANQKNGTSADELKQIMSKDAFELVSELVDTDEYTFHHYYIRNDLWCSFTGTIPSDESEVSGLLSVIIQKGD